MASSGSEQARAGTVPHNADMGSRLYHPAPTKATVAAAAVGQLRWSSLGVVREISGGVREGYF